MLKVLHLFLFFHKKVKWNLYSFHVLFIKEDRCAATSEKQMFGFQKEHS